jgi:hypothetical protein
VALCEDLQGLSERWREISLHSVGSPKDANRRILAQKVLLRRFLRLDAWQQCRRDGVAGGLRSLHAYKERDRTLSKKAKKHYKSKNGGKLYCIACGLDPEELYSEQGDRCIEAHHKIPIEELQPDSITRVDDLLMVCASCHRVIHSQKPCLTIVELQALKKDAA